MPVVSRLVDCGTENAALEALACALTQAASSVRALHFRRGAVNSFDDSKNDCNRRVRA
jgi:hypothetical protein